MIKINLINSVTERQTGTVAAADRKISSGSSRFLLLSVVVGFLLAAAKTCWTNTLEQFLR